MDWSNALLAGLAGGAAMTVLMTLSRMAGMIDANMAQYQGCMITRKDHGAGTMIAGLVMHLMISALIGLLYAWAFGEIWGRATAMLGASAAVVHWLVAGMVLPVFDGMNPCVRDGRIASFGAFGQKRGPMLIFGFFLGHLVYGAIVGAIYEVPLGG